jgi:hypothetical protein
MLFVSSIVFFVLLLIWIGLIFLRKTLWDGVHRNLLDLEDNYDGKIIRNGFATRPVFKGNINNTDVTINFSTAKFKSGRRTYIDFTLTISSGLSITIAEKNWLIEQNGDNHSVKTELKIDDNVTYVIMPPDNHKINRIIAKEEFRRSLAKFENLAYFFVGKSGTICEFWSDKIDRDTTFEIMKSRLDQIRILLSILN